MIKLSAFADEAADELDRQISALKRGLFKRKAIFSCGESSRSFYGKREYGNGHEALISDFYGCLSSGNKFLIDVNEGAKVVRLILATYSLQERKTKIK